MTEAQAFEALTKHWIDQVAIERPTLAFTFENEAFEAVDVYAAISFVSTLRRQRTQGTNPKYENRGFIFVQLFGSLNVGVLQLSELVGVVRKIYETKTIAPDLNTYSGTSRPAPSEGRWARRTVTIPYWFDE